MNIFRPEAIIIGGGISKEGDYLTDKIKAYAENYSYGYPGSPVIDVVCAKLGNAARDCRCGFTRRFRGKITLLTPKSLTKSFDI